MIQGRRVLISVKSGQNLPQLMQNGVCLTLAGMGSRSYSHLNACMGSTFTARQAGIKEAASATTVRSPTAPINVRGSFALTP